MATQKKKKSAPRKKKVTEARYKVSKTKSNAGTNDTDEESIYATDGSEAVVKSMKGDANKGKYDSVETMVN